MKAKHLAVFKSYLKRKGNREITCGSGMQKKIADYGKKDQINVKLSKSAVIEGMVQLVTVDGRPFCSVEDEGIRQAFGPVFEKLDFHLDRHNITELVGFAANFILEEIKALLENRLISVKVDCATRLHRSFLGLNVQVINLVLNFLKIINSLS